LRAADYREFNIGIISITRREDKPSDDGSQGDAGDCADEDVFGAVDFVFLFFKIGNRLIIQFLTKFI
jgi:hypothetical protein